MKSAANGLFVIKLKSQRFWGCDMKKKEYSKEEILAKADKLFDKIAIEMGMTRKEFDDIVEEIKNSPAGQKITQKISEKTLRL